MSTGVLPTYQAAPIPDFHDIRLQMTPAVTMTQDQFFDFCQQNSVWRFERSAQGELIIMAPSGGEAGFQDAEVCIQLGNWAAARGQGTVAGSSTGFILPNGANRAPDASWLSPDQLAAITPAQRKKFLPVCPFFLVEVRSPSDGLKTLREKMDEYIANGCKLDWLIDPEIQQVHVYRPDQPVEVHDNPTTISGDPELPGFVLDLEPVWRP